MFKSHPAKSPEEYLKSLEEPRRSEVETLHKLIRKTAPKLEPFMISGMMGYGKFHYKSSSGREGDWCVIGLASQKNYISVYLCAPDEKGYLAEQNKARFPKASIGKSCIRFKKSSDIDLKVLAELIKKSEETVAQKK